MTLLVIQHELLLHKICTFTIKYSLDKSIKLSLKILFL